jgi:sulfate adenylyltransferase subunit 1
MGWYKGETLLRLLETIEVDKSKDHESPRFPVQTIIRPHSSEYHDYRGYAGRVASGVFKTGEEIIVLPSMLKSKIKSIEVFEKILSEASAGESVTLTLEDEIDISRGDLIVRPLDMPQISQDLNLMLCWFNEKPLHPSGKYVIRNYSNDATCQIKAVDYKVNIETLEKDSSDISVRMNDIACIRIRTSKPICFDTYERNHITGSLILIDEGSNETVAAGMLVHGN